MAKCRKNRLKSGAGRLSPLLELERARHRVGHDLDGGADVLRARQYFNRLASIGAVPRIQPLGGAQQRLDDAHRHIGVFVDEVGRQPEDFLRVVSPDLIVRDDGNPDIVSRPSTDSTARRRSSLRSPLVRAFSASGAGVSRTAVRRLQASPSGRAQPAVPQRLWGRRSRDGCRRPPASTAVRSCAWRRGTPWPA